MKKKIVKPFEPVYAVMSEGLRMEFFENRAKAEKCVVRLTKLSTNKVYLYKLETAYCGDEP